MKIINLNVSYAEKDQAKNLGALWDRQNKTWYIKEGQDVKLFEKWIKTEPINEINVKGNLYYIAQSSCNCWKCGNSTRVYGIFLSNTAKSIQLTYQMEDDSIIEDYLSEDDEFDSIDGKNIYCWEIHGEGYVYYLKYLDNNTLMKIQQISSGQYYYDYSSIYKSSYFMNHCETCSAKQGDWNLYCEPGGAFTPNDYNQAQKIVFYQVSEEFTANNGGSTYNEPFISCIKIIK